MMRWLAGSVLVSSFLVSATTFAQAPKPAPAPTAAFPAAPTPAPAPAATPAPAPAPAPAPTPAPAAPAPAPALAPAAPGAAPAAPAPAVDGGAALPPPPPASPPPPPAPARGSALPPTYVEPPPPPPRDLDARPIRLRRPFIIGGELAWNGLAGFGVNFSYHPIPQLGLDTGLGLSLTGWRIGARARYNFLTGDWTPFLGGGMAFASGFGDQAIDAQYGTDKAKMKVAASPFAQAVGGVNYTGTEGFAFTAAVGYSFLLKDKNTTYVSGSTDAYNYVKGIYNGGVILSIAFGYAF